MEIHAYNKLYLENTMSAMGIMLDYAVNYRHWEIDKFFQAFLETKLLPQQFEVDTPTLLPANPVLNCTFA